MINWDLNSDRGKQEFANWVDRTIKNEVNSYARQVLGIGNSIKNKIINPSEFIPPSAEVYRTADYTYTTSANIAFNAKNWDTDGMTNPSDYSRITIKTAGLYIVGLSGGVSTSGTFTQAYPNLLFYNSSGVQKNRTLHYATINSTSNAIYTDNSFVISLNVGDYITSSITLAGTGTYTLQGSPTPDYTQTRLNATWIGKLI